MTSNFSFGAKTLNLGSKPGGLFGGTSTSSGGGLFGSTTTPSSGGLFGTTTTPSSGGLFGATSTTGLGGGGIFGAKTNPSTGLFGSTPSGGLFGATSTGGGNVFGAAGTTTGQTGGGLFGGTSTGTGLFGATAQQPGGLFGANTSGAGLFGGNTSSLQAQQQAAQVAQLSLSAALSSPQLFGDERNAVIAKWNQLQAFWGTGKGYFHPNSPPVQFSPENRYCRLKAVAFSKLPTSQDEDGLLSLVFHRPASEVLAKQQQVIDALFSKVFSSNQAISIHVEAIKPITDDKCESIIYVVEKLSTGIQKRIPASKLHQFLMQPNQTRELSNAGVQLFRPNKTISDSELQQYLDAPPLGIHPLLWQQANRDNPDPLNLVPIPVLGFKEMLQRLKQQQLIVSQHNSRLKTMKDTLAEIKNRQATSQTQIEEHKRKILDIGHRILKLVSAQEVLRKLGYSTLAGEEGLRMELEALNAELNAPNRFKCRLNELLAHIRLQGGTSSFQGSSYGQAQYKVEPKSQEELIQYLRQEQSAIMQLVAMVKESAADVQVMVDGLGAQGQKSGHGPYN